MLENTRSVTTMQKQAVIATMGCVNAYCSGSPMMERRTRRAHGVCQASLKLKHPFSVRFFPDELIVDSTQHLKLSTVQLFDGVETASAKHIIPT